MRVRIGPYYNLSNVEPAFFRRPFQFVLALLGIHNPDRKQIKIHNSDVWNLDITLSKIIEPALIAFKEDITVNYPCSPAKLSYKKWIAIVDDMIYAHNMIANEKHLYAKEDECARMQRGLKYFAKYYTNLWT